MPLGPTPCPADEARGPGYTRAAPVDGGFKKILSFVRVNGKDVMSSVESGTTMMAQGDAAVFFPASKHKHDPTSGPIVVARTPDLEVGEMACVARCCWGGVDGVIDCGRQEGG